MFSAARASPGRRRRRGFAVALAAVCALGATSARAEPDHRPPDRFAFGLALGTAVDEAPQAAGAFETSFWPNDWIGLGTRVSLSASHTYDVGGELMLAVPLRWVQPYAGVEGGLRTAAGEVTRRVSLFAGMNAYASANLRLFVELRDLPQVDLVGETHEPLVLAGLRHSPDWFHRARGVTKVDTVWWSVLLTAAIWGAATYAQ